MSHVSHIIVGCAADDRLDMTILMTGMGVHSDLLNWHLNLFYEDVSFNQKAGFEAPKLQLWYGLTPPEFPWDVLATLMTSVNWKNEYAIRIWLEKDGELDLYALRPFFHAVREGKIK